MSHTIRSALWLAFFASILVSWVVLYQMATGMGLDWIGRAAMTMDMPMGDGQMHPVAADEAATERPMGAEGGDMMAPMDGTAPAMGADGGMGMMDMSAMTRFGPLFGMWSLMMAAMMLPTLVPTLLTYDQLITSADGSRVGWLGVLGGYSVVWIGVAALFAATQLALVEIGAINMMGLAQSAWIAGGLLIAVGLYQFSQPKQVCHGVCHAPMTYFLGHWAPGAGGGLRMGLALGAYCAGCCWGFMALGFVGGMMSLLWMGLATLFMVIEKLPQIGHHITRPLGVALILGGLGVLIAPTLLG